MILVVGLVVHDAVETGADHDPLDHGQRLQIEHRDGHVAAVGRKAVTGLGGDAGAVHARRVRNVAEHFARSAFDHHHVGGTRNEHVARGGFDGDVVRAAVPFDIELFNLERLRVPDAGRGKKAGCREKGKSDQQVSGHAGPPMVVAKRGAKACRKTSEDSNYPGSPLWTSSLQDGTLLWPLETTNLPPDRAPCKIAVRPRPHKGCTFWSRF